MLHALLYERAIQLNQTWDSFEVDQDERDELVGLGQVERPLHAFNKKARWGDGIQLDVMHFRADGENRGRSSHTHVVIYIVSICINQITDLVLIS